VATLETIAAEVERAQFAAPAVVVIGDVVRERESIRWFDRGPLFGKRVLITRPLAQSDRFAQQLWEAGAEPLVAPAIVLGPPDDSAAAAAAVARVREYAWVVFTSVNGVNAFFDLLGAGGRDARAFGDAKVAAIGTATAGALTRNGIRVDFVPAVYVNEAVAAGLIERTAPGERVLVFRAQEARDVLPATLRAAGRSVDVVAGYKTRFVDDPNMRALAAGADVVTFTSSSTVHGFAHNVPGAPEVLSRAVVAAIGPITAATARRLGIRVDVVADEFTLEGLLAALEAGVGV